jgi:hypothetical protein
MYGDGAGLYLNIGRTGSKSWIWRGTVDGKRREIGLGGVRDVSLAQAREAAALARERVRKGQDPRGTDETAEAAPAVPTFTTCAARYIRAHRRGWANRKHARQWVSTLKTYARPVIGTKPVDQIGTQYVLRILSPFWTGKSETAERVQGRVENVLDYFYFVRYPQLSLQQRNPLFCICLPDRCQSLFMALFHWLCLR